MLIPAQAFVLGLVLRLALADRDIVLVLQQRSYGNSNVSHSAEAALILSRVLSDKRIYENIHTLVR